MLEKYADHLKFHRINYFWNKHLNLLKYHSDGQIAQYFKDITNMIEDVTTNPNPNTIKNYLGIIFDNL